MKAMKELIILVGMQGCGKTRYCQTVLTDHCRISQDEGPRSFDGVVRRLGGLLESGTERIVIDRTNPLRDQRERSADLARACGYRVRIIYFDVPREICEQRIQQRRDHPTLSPEKMKQALDRFDSVLEKQTEEECDKLMVIRD